MISYLYGTVIDKDLTSVILDVNNVGYRVTVTGQLLQEANLSDPLQVFTYMAVRENAMDLYGFKSKEELEMFELLNTISGIGPKSAMATLSAASVETLKEGISSGDAAYLSKISGVGRKSAEKIVVGLKDKIGIVAENADGTGNQSTVAIDALIALGYSERESRDAINAVKKSDNPEEMIKEALKNLNG